MANQVVQPRVQYMCVTDRWKSDLNSEVLTLLRVALDKQRQIKTVATEKFLSPMRWHALPSHASAGWPPHSHRLVQCATTGMGTSVV